MRRGSAAFLGRSSARLARLVVRIVPAARIAIGLEAKLLVLRVLDVEMRRLELLQEPGRRFEGISSRVLEPVPYGVAALIVADPAGRP